MKKAWGKGVQQPNLGQLTFTHPTVTSPEKIVPPKETGLHIFCRGVFPQNALGTSWRKFKGGTPY